MCISPDKRLTDQTDSPVQLRAVKQQLSAHRVGSTPTRRGCSWWLRAQRACRLLAGQWPCCLLHTC